MTVASATRRSYAAQVAPNRAPGSMPGSAGPPSPKLRVIQIEPSFFGKPWIQPRASAKSRSTQMYEQTVTSSPSSRPLTTTNTSLYCERDGSTSSSPPSEHDCQSAATNAQRPGSGCGSMPSGRNATALSGSAQ